MHPRIRRGIEREAWQQNRGRNVDSLKIIQIHDKFYELEATLHNFLVINFWESHLASAHWDGGKEL